MARKATIYDISKSVGVSTCCVSWVLRNHPRSREVGPETRRRILQTADEMGYVCNQLASATSTGKVNTIAVILNFNIMQDQLTANQLMTGIMMETARRGLNVKVFSEDDLENAFRNIVETRIVKVISTSVEAGVRQRTAGLAEKYSLDLVFCYERGHGRFPAVNTDNVEMTVRAVHYLADHGHTRIALLCVPHRWQYVQDRHDGYLLGMAQCGLTVDPRWVSCSDDIDSTVEMMLALSSDQRPSAFITLADPIAAAAQRCAWKHGLRIPEDFSVIGIGDTESAKAAVVPITTFREIFPDTGKLLVRLAFGEKPDFPPDEFNVYHTHAELIERDSVYDIKQRRKSDCNRFYNCSK